MPANLTAAYKTAEATYRAAVTREEKLAALEEMLRVIPKHKGTEKLQGDLRSRIAKLRREPARKGAARGMSHRVPREGAGQVVLVGPPNGGKSSLVATLTAASPAVADYPMSTREATPGMMPFRDIAFQLVDLPPVCEEHVESWVYDVIRGGELAWLVVSITDPVGELETVERLLGERAIRLVPEPAEVAAAEDRRPGWTYLPAFLVVTGLDLPGAREDLGVLEELLPRPWPLVAVSTVTGEGMAALGERTFEALRIIRVYSREPGHEPDLERPFTLPIGATVGDLARAIHGEIAEGLKFARVWGAAAFEGPRVNRDHVLADGDIVELRA
jgi:uncharacterized protein